MNSEEYYLREGKGTWRMARKQHKCDGLGYRDPWKCIATGLIEIGESYLDTRELTSPPWGTRKMCRICTKRDLPI